MRSTERPGAGGALEELLNQCGMIPPGCTVLCAVSGGADSICLLHRLYRLRSRLGFQLVAAHYNHSLRGEESDRDEEFVREFVALCCGPERWLGKDGAVRRLPAVELLVGRGDVAAEARRRKAGVEETARALRYHFLRAAARQVGADRIATAHTADDNAETVLLHLARGSGLRGLSGIWPVRGDLIRPLLTTTRREVEDYLRFWGLPHMEDSSNQDEAFARNRLRRQVIPQLEALYPGFARRMAGTAARLRADEAVLEEEAQKVCVLAVVQGRGLSIPVQAVADLPAALAARVVRGLIGRLCQGNDNCTATHLEAVLSVCRGSAVSARVDLPHGLTARRAYENLIVAPAEAPQTFAPLPLPLPGWADAGRYRITVAALNYAGQEQAGCEFYLSQALAPELTVRPRRTGDALAAPGRPRRSLKKRMIEEKIPRGERETIPVLECGGKVAAVVGFGPDRAFLPQIGRPCWHIVAQRLE